MKGNELFIVFMLTPAEVFFNEYRSPPTYHSIKIQFKLMNEYNHKIIE
jgi:hypothetical protein